MTASPRAQNLYGNISLYTYFDLEAEGNGVVGQVELNDTLQDGSFPDSLGDISCLHYFLCCGGSNVECGNRCALVRGYCCRADLPFFFL